MRVLGVAVVAVLLTACQYVGEFIYNEIPVDPSLAGDPLSTYAFHLENRAQKAFYSGVGIAGYDLNMLETIGDGVEGAGIKVCVSDQGVESTHDDLAANILAGQSVDYSVFPYGTSPDPIDMDDDHGTAVAGVIAAVANNGKGARGIAPSAQWASKNFLSLAVVFSSAIQVEQATGAFDIFNYSWGAADEHDIWVTDPAFEAEVLNGVTTLRAGLGAVYVKAAGNSYSTSTLPLRHASANIDGDNNLPYMITVGGVGPRGIKASYSSAGSSLWVAGLTGEFDYPNIVTADRTGCALGYASTTYASYFPSFNYTNSSLNPSCKYNIGFNGTSAAAPTISGVVALLLEVEPTLTWRDVKHILAQTARPIDARTSFDNEYVDSPTGHTWEQGWVTNDAGFHFHNYYGFGLVDTDAAVSLARNYTSGLGAYIETTGGAGPWDFARTGLATAIPDDSATGATDTMTVATSLTIEGVQIRLNVTHTNIEEIGVELTSPAGTKSIVMNVNNSLVGVADFVDNVFLTNAFYGEDSAGMWTVKLIDGESGATGTLTSWELRFVGH